MARGKAYIFRSHSCFPFFFFFFFPYATTFLSMGLLTCSLLVVRLVLRPYLPTYPPWFPTSRPYTCYLNILPLPCFSLLLRPLLLSPISGPRPMTSSTSCGLSCHGFARELSCPTSILYSSSPRPLLNLFVILCCIAFSFRHTHTYTHTYTHTHIHPMANFNPRGLLIVD